MATAQAESLFRGTRYDSSLGGRAESHIDAALTPKFEVFSEKPFPPIILFPEIIKADAIENKSITPSAEAAWLIGYLSNGGSVSKSGTIKGQGYSEPLLSKFVDFSIHVLNLEPHLTLGKNENKQSLKYVSAEVNNKPIAEKLGNLNRDKWVETLSTQYRWIFDINDELYQTEYAWKFLEAIIDTSTSIVDGKINLNTSFRTSAEFYCNLLQSLGINDAIILKDAKAREGIRGVQVGRNVSIKKLADNVHSADVSIEEKLNTIRQKEDFIEKRVPQNREEVIDSWKMLKDMLGHVPTAQEIDILRGQGKIRFSRKVYVNYFGGTFCKARESLEAILYQRQEETTQQKQEAFASTYNANYETILKYIRFNVPSGLAEDLAATVFEKGWKAFETYTPQKGVDIKFWFLKIARHLVIDYYKDNPQRPKNIDEVGISLKDKEQTPEQLAMSLSDREKLREAILSISETNREALILYYIQGRNYKEIAQMLGNTEANARLRVYRALQEIKRKYKTREELLEGPTGNITPNLLQRDHRRVS